MLVLFAVLVIGGFYLVTLFQPRPVATMDDIGYASEEELIDMLRQSEDLESEFLKSEGLAEIPESEAEKLRKAISLLETYIDKARATDKHSAERLSNMRKKLQNIEAKPLAEEVARLEVEALQYRNSEGVDKLRPLYFEAQKIQNRINNEFPLSKYRNLSKSLEYDRNIRMLEARPLYERGLAAEKDAGNAVKNSQWDKAAEKYAEAISLVNELHEKFPTSPFTDFSRIQRLDSELASLRSSEQAAKVDALAESARGLVESGRFVEGAELYADAYETQKSLNELYPRSRYASSARISELDRAKSEAYAMKFYSEISAQDALLTDAVAKGDSPRIADLSVNLLRKVDQFKKDYPKSLLLKDETVLRLRYINIMVRNIGKIQSMVAPNLVRVADGAYMFKTEVTRRLYSLVMHENPSRSAGSDMSPVDSVSYEDAARFCVRLSWILARRVDLPTASVYKKAVGSLRYVDINAVSWNLENSGGTPHEVATKQPNDAGFYDLLGNVSEFVKNENMAAAGVEIAGGSAQTSTDSVSEMPLERVDGNQRSRLVGFRFMVFDR